jgi:hypothetical protein
MSFTFPTDGPPDLLDSLLDQLGKGKPKGK